MIQRVYLKDLVTFENVTLEFENTLIVITGPSGAGKSILMGAILGCFGYNQLSYATLCELSLDAPISLSSDIYEFDKEIILKSIKKDKLRFFINDQLVSKKGLQELFAPHVHYLSVRDKSTISSLELIDIIDSAIASDTDLYNNLLVKYKQKYQKLIELQGRLETIEQKEKNADELLEFARFEVEKIENINPKIGEDESLLKIKSRLSKLDKIKDTLNSLEGLFELEPQVYELHKLLDKDSLYFSDAFTQLRVNIDDAIALQEELSELDIEQLLDRIEKLSSLKNRYGSIEQTLEYLRVKKEEIEGFVHIKNDKEHLSKEIIILKDMLQKEAQEISRIRQEKAKDIEKTLGGYLAKLKLNHASFLFLRTPLNESGIDLLDLSLGDSKIETLSGGEFNRLKIALLASAKAIGGNKGVLILDEIDANVSGDESIAIAQMLQFLSRSYQIFAISHQPHLTSKADQHLLVTKNGSKSEVQFLDGDERIAEIARIIDGKEPTSEAIEFAKKILG